MAEQSGGGSKSSSGSSSKSGSSAAKRSSGGSSSSGRSGASKSGGSSSASKSSGSASKSSGSRSRSASGGGASQSRAKSNSNGGSGSSSSRLSGPEAVKQARRQLTDLMGRPIEAVLGMERDDSGWVITAQVVELARIPNSTDVLGEYAVTVDNDGEVIGYRRIGRYLRSQADGDS